MFKRNYMRNYKWMMGSLIILGVILVMFTRINPETFKAEYLSGLGVGFIFAAVINLVIMTIKMRNSDFEEEFEMSMQDERVKHNKMKSLAYGGGVAIGLLCFFNILNAFTGFDMIVGNIIVLLSYSVAVGFFKWYFRNR